MTIARTISELLHGKVHYTSDNGLTWINALGSPMPMEVRVQGEKPFVYFAANRADGWTPLSPEMARTLAKSLLTAAETAERLAPSNTSTKAAP